MKRLLALLLIPQLGIAVNFGKLIKDTEPKMVKIGIIEDGLHGVCSGEFISSTGLVLTCAHCFEHGTIRKVFIKTSSEKVYKAALLHIDEKRDLAIVVPDSIGPFPYFKFGPEPKIGDQVLAFGSPLAIQHTASLGWVENIIHQTKMYILHNAPINPGSSGGALIDMKGRLVGVNEAILGINSFQLAEGMFLAIDIITVKDFLREQEAY